jgi:hypothetical protein
MGDNQGEVAEGTGALVPAQLPHLFSTAGANRFVVLDFECAAPAGSFFSFDTELYTTPVRRALALMQQRFGALLTVADLAAAAAQCLRMTRDLDHGRPSIQVCAAWVAAARASSPNAKVRASRSVWMISSSPPSIRLLIENEATNGLPADARTDVATM